MFLRRMVAVFATLSVLLVPGALTAQDDGQPEGRIRALVIGNVGYDPSKYQVIQWKPLVGAYNDAVMITQKLLDEGVSRDAITLLTDPPSAELREQKRGLELFETDIVPDGIGTRDNILGALKQLALTTRPGDEVLITFSGHGYQQREMVAGNEPDGLDEIFIPLDVRDPAPGDSEKRLPGAITDDEIGAAIDAIRAKGGNVTYLADYCHSGDSMRNAGEDSDLPPAGLLAEPKFADIGDGDFVQDLAVEASKGKPGWGSFVAMMAAPSAIQAKQERAPGFWPRDEQKTLGILTAYSFANLSNPQVVTYRDLAARVGSNFSEYEKKAPRPLFDGDLDRPILGGLLKSASDERRDSWLVTKPRRDLEAETMAVASLEMSAGAFQGVTESTIIALSSVRGEGEKVLLYGQVASTTAFTAKLVPVSFNGIDAAQWQDIRDADGDRFSREAKLIATVAQRPVDVSFRVARPAPPSNPTPAQKVALEWFAQTEPGPLGATFVAPGEEAELAFRLDGDRLAMEEAGTRVTDYGTMDLGELIARGGEDEVAGVLGPAIVRAARFHKLRKVLASNDGLGTQEDNPAEKVAIRFHLLRQDDPVDAEGNCRVPPDAGLGREQVSPLSRPLGESGFATSDGRIFRKCDILTVEIENVSNEEIYVNPLYFTSSGAIYWRAALRDRTDTRYPPGRKGTFHIQFAKAMEAQRLQDELIVLVSEAGDGTAVSFAQLGQGPVLEAASKREAQTAGMTLAASTLRSGPSRGIAVEDIIASIFGGASRSGTVGKASATGAVRYEFGIPPATDQ